MSCQFSQKSIISFCFLILPLFLFSQKSAPKWGKVSDEEFQLTTCEFDSAATAVILSDQANFRMVFGEPMTIERHQRIKILKPTGSKYADIDIPFYSEESFEKVKGLKAQTISIDESGKVTKQKLAKSDFFENKIDENWSEIKFTFPNVQPGTILEYKYTLLSQSVTNLKKWYFQNNIPTLHSEVSGQIEEGLDYNTLLRGSQLFEKYNGKSTQSSWSLDNVPAIKKEPYCASIRDHVERIEFQLAGYKKLNMVNLAEYVNLMSTWEEFTNDVLKFETYRHYLGKKRFTKKTLSTILDGNENDLEKVKKISTYLGETLKWNEEYWIYKNQNLSDLLKFKTGNSAEINLFFVSLLREAGLEAHPALTSTKSNGRISTIYPLRTQFNHILAAVEINGQYQLFDATHPTYPFDLLAPENLNDQAFLLKKSSEAVWIDIPNKKTSVESVQVEMTINEEGETTYDIALGATKYKAHNHFQNILKAEEPSEFLKKFLSSHFEDADLLDFTIESIPTASQALKVKIKVQPKEKIDLEASILYLNPFVKAKIEQPFKAEKRVFPIDFYYPKQYQYAFKLNIPEGFVVADLPEQMNLTFGDKSLSLSYYVKQNGEEIDLLAKFIVKSTRVSVTDYAALRHLFNRYVSQTEALIVLKKKEN